MAAVASFMLSNDDNANTLAMDDVMNATENHNILLLIFSFMPIS